MSATLEEQAEAVGDDLGEAFCLTVVLPQHPWSLAEVVTRLGGEPSALRSGVIVADEDL
jgi:hypothetical protein